MTPKTRATPREAAPANPLARWARQGVESFVAAQKILLDLTAQQNALAIGMIRERLSRPAYRPDLMIAKMADKGVESLTAAGKILLELAAGETAVVVEGLKKAVPLPMPAGAAVEVVRQRVETLINLQKELLDATAEQTHTLAESYRKGKGMMAVEGVAELARKGIEGFVETEKKFLDLASEQVFTVLKGGKGHEAAADRSKALIQMAREGLEKYIRAQKQLLELMIEQFEFKGEVAEHPEAARRKPHTSLAELTEKSVRNLVTAQKSLMDLAIRPITGSEIPRHPAGPVRHKKAHVAAPQAA